MPRLRVTACWLLGLWLLIVPAAAGQGDDRVTPPPPAQETPEVGKVIDQAKAALEGGKSVSDILTDRAYSNVHAWPRFRELIRRHATTSPIRLTTSDEPGDALAVEGTILNAGGEPVANALVYVYHTSAKGWYSDVAAHISGNAGDPQHARLFGYLKTDARGKFAFRTIRPAGYPRTDLPAHIHLTIERPGHEVFWTEIQFDDDPRLTAKWRAESKQAGFVICPVRKDDQGVQHVRAEFRLKD